MTGYLQRPHFLSVTWTNPSGLSTVVFERRLSRRQFHRIFPRICPQGYSKVHLHRISRGSSMPSTKPRQLSDLSHPCENNDIWCLSLNSVDLICGSQPPDLGYPGKLSRFEILSQVSRAGNHFSFHLRTFESVAAPSGSLSEPFQRTNQTGKHRVIQLKESIPCRFRPCGQAL